MAGTIMKGDSGMKLWHVKYAVPTPGGTPQVVEEDFFLPSQNDVRRYLRGRGAWPINIYERKKPLLEWFDVRSQKWALQLLRALRFQTATTSAGTALLNIIENESDSKRRMAFLPTRTVLKAGGTFADALRQLRLLDSATLAIIIAGEKASDLKGVIPHAIQHIEEKNKQMRIVITALSWVAFDIFSVLSTVIGAQWQFIPYLKEKGIESTDAAAVAKFQKSVALGEALNIGLLIFCTGLVAMGVAGAYTYLRNRDKPDHWLNRIVTKTPIFSTYLQNVSLSDSSRLLSRLLRGHVALDDALKILIGATIDPTVLDYWRASYQRMMSGTPPMKALSREPLNKTERDQIVTAQTSMDIAEVFDSIADERQLMGKDSQRKIFLLGMFIMMTVFGIVTMVMLYLVMIQNSGFMDSMQNMRQGGE